MSWPQDIQKPSRQPSSQRLSRVHLCLWLLRPVQLAFALAILALAVKNTTHFTTLSCDVPPKIRSQVIVASVTIPLLLYPLLSTGPCRPFNLLPHTPVVLLPLDILFFGGWLITACTTLYNTCTDVCTACGFIWEEFDGCVCQVVRDVAEGYARNGGGRKGVAGSDYDGDGDMDGVASGRWRRRKGLEEMVVLLTVLFGISLAVTVGRIAYRIYRSRTAKGSSLLGLSTVRRLSEGERSEETVRKQPLGSAVAVPDKVGGKSADRRTTHDRLLTDDSMEMPYQVKFADPA